MQKLQIDKEFMSLSVPLSEEELQSLEQSLLNEGCLEPITTWHGYILDGHKRYSICKNNNLDYEVIETEYLSRNEAIAAMCRERLRNIKTYIPSYKYLIGRLYHSVAEINNVSRLEYRNELSNDLADELGIKYITVLRYGMYSSGLERILSFNQTLFDEIIKGEVLINRDEMIEMAKYNERTFIRICRKYCKCDDIRLRDHTPHGKRKQHIHRDNNNEKNETEALSVGVKEMPVSDPDRELRGLTLTVPMWISSISRAIEHTNISDATDTAKIQLSTALNNLIEQINITLEELQ